MVGFSAGLRAGTVRFDVMYTIGGGMSLGISRRNWGLAWLILLISWRTLLCSDLSSRSDSTSLTSAAAVPVLVTPSIFGQKKAVVPSASVQTRVVLGTYSVGPHEKLAYELSIAPCDSDECSFQVRLLSGNTEVGSIDLDWAKANGKLSRDEAAESSGLGDPLDVEKKRSVAWSTGEEDANVLTTAMTVRLTPQLDGLLVSQRAGFERFKRSYDLYVAMGRKLVRTWEFREGTGPTWSTVELSEQGRGGPQNVLLFNGFRYPGNDQPDWLYFTVYSWNSSKNQLESVSGDPMVNALIAGTYDTVAQARAAQASATCLSAFWVLTSGAFSQLHPGKFVLAAITARKPLADRKLAEVRTCAPKLSVSQLDSTYRQPENN